MAAFLFTYIWYALDIALRTYPGEGLNWKVTNVTIVYVENVDNKMTEELFLE